MITRLVFGIALLLAAPWSLLAEVQFNSFEIPNQGTPVGYLVSDVYLGTGEHQWLSSVFYCELDEGELYFAPGFPEQPRWICIPGVNDFDSWVAPGISVYGDGNELAGLPQFSGNPDEAAASITFIPDIVGGAVPAWDGIATRLVFSSHTIGRWALKVSEKGPGVSIYTGTITNGRIDWPQPLEGDLTFDGFADESDLDVLKEHWGADPIILGDFSSGDASYDGAVTSADLDIIRANWAGSPPASAVPEPGWCGLTGVLFFFYGLGRRR